MAGGGRPSRRNRMATAEVRYGTARKAHHPVRAGRTRHAAAAPPGACGRSQAGGRSGCRPNSEQMAHHVKNAPTAAHTYAVAGFNIWTPQKSHEGGSTRSGSTR
eukprot:6738684-Prymnesium_polylepis.1